MPAFYKFAADAPKLGPVVHVTIEYQTTSGSRGAWSRWVHYWDHCEDELTRALDFATEHVRRFKRVHRIYGGSASPLMRPEKSPGQRAYEEDVRLCPVYHDGSARRPWAQIGELAQMSWEKNPTPRAWNVRHDAHPAEEGLT